MKEGQRIEWKESWRDDWFKCICGFANAEGGALVIGRNDKGKVVGVSNGEKLLEEIPNKVRDLLGILVDVSLQEEDGKEFLEIRVEPYPNPISYRGEYYYRSDSTTQTLKGAALDRFLLRKHGRSWDGVPVPYVGVNDLDAKVLAGFRKLAAKSERLPPEVLEESEQNLLEKLLLFEGKYLKRAAVLLFHPEPERFVTGAFIKIGYFESNVDLRYQDEVQGDLFTQVSRTLEILKAKYMKAWISYEGIQRIETWPVPEPALREAILNAVVHKDYSTGIPIQISVYPDKLMIWNPGQLPPEWTLEKLLGKHASQPHNPDIARAFFRTGRIESWGRGIERILAASAQAGNPAPEFRVESTGLWTIFPFLPATAQEAPGKTSGLLSGRATGKTSGNTAEQVLSLLKAEPSLTVPELADRVSKSDRVVLRALAQLQSEGLLKRVGSRKVGHWEVLPETTQKIPMDVAGKTSGLLSGKATGKTSGNTAAQVLSLLKAEPSLTVPELADRVSRSDRVVLRALAQLQSEGFLKRVGSRKVGHWEVLK